MSTDLKQKMSAYLLELALEEQLERDEDMNKYPLPDDITCPHVFSEEHEKRMKELFKMAERTEHRVHRKRKLFQTAAGIALFLCVSSLTVTQVEAFRLPVYRFISDVMEKATFYDVEEVQTELNGPYKRYAPTYIPEGFYVTKIDEGETYFGLSYKNNDTGTLFDLFFREKIDGFLMDTEDAAMKETEINGNHAYIAVKDSGVRILMYIDSHQIFLAGTIEEAEAVKILESIE